MAPKMHRIRIGPQGRIVVPVELRREFGIEPGDDVVAWVDDGRLVFQQRSDVVQELWDMFADVEGSLSEELIRERREEARREAEREG